ncbi:hypothetical protein [Ensifer soli]|uniref:hypothetical protein n=1 Tax=Ciceribacter sp. sgz301302 TaxID=3342379 RepID=UPI0035B6CCC2
MTTTPMRRVPAALVFHLLLAASLALAPGDAVRAQSTDGGSSGQSQSRPGHGGGSVAASPLSQTATNGIILNIRAVVSECRRYDPVYRTDCLAQGLRDVARRVPRGPDYDEMRAAIASASGKLGAIARRDADPQAPALRSRPGANTRFRASRRYTATKPARLRKTLSDAAHVVDALQTQLLRSGGNSAKRAVHFQQVAAAAGSTKVLLRS